MARTLTRKQEAFCRAVITEDSYANAYRKAYDSKKMSAEAIHVEATKLLKDPKIALRVEELRAPLAAQAQMKRREWLEWMTRCVRFDPRKLFDARGDLKPISELDENEATAIAGFDVQGDFHAQDGLRKTVRIKIRFIDRIGALALMGKACHWYADRQELTGRDGQQLQPLTGITVEFVGAAPKR